MGQPSHPDPVCGRPLPFNPPSHHPIPIVKSTPYSFTPTDSFRFCRAKCNVLYTILSTTFKAKQDAMKRQIYLSSEASGI
ncbi:hypothetical protein J6590_056074 [Homalodisca vitripennis]|nr:hypothetical protein J6590_056074 [Homalodisca vitripennis]